jgi:predicted RNA binding protein YcfA (HicA-like mRNA interferase family)
MSSRPAYTGIQLIRALQRLGFEVVRVKGSHHFLRHPDGHTAVIPVHSGDTIGRGLLMRILDACDLGLDDIHP